MMDMEKIGIVGAGAWGTSMAILQAKKGHDVEIWAYEKQTVKGINENHENQNFLPDIELPKNIKATHSLKKIVEEHRVIVMAMPSHVTRKIVEQIKEKITKDHSLIILAKGIEENTSLFMSEVYEAVLPTMPTIAVLSGPNFAYEVALGKPTAAVLACSNEPEGERLRNILSSLNYRIYYSPDIVGVQIAGTIKNVIAIVAGICDGMQLGLSARAALICRGIAEMNRLGQLLGGKIETFIGLSGVGDLILTATGSLSRNYSLGVALGQGTRLADYLKTKQSIAEGVKNAASINELAIKHNIDLPICKVAFDVLYSDLSCEAGLRILLNRETPLNE